MFRLTASLQKGFVFLTMCFAIVLGKDTKLVSVADIFIRTQYIDVYCVEAIATKIISTIPSNKVLLIDNDLYINHHFKYDDDDETKRNIAIGCDDDDIRGFRHSDVDDGIPIYNHSYEDDD
jgi:hypothetical protein